MGFARLNELENTLRKLEAQNKEYKEKLKKKQARNREVEDIKNNMVSVCDSKSNDVNTLLKSIRNDLPNAIIGIDNSYHLAEVVKSDEDRGISDGGRMSQAYSDIRMEKAAVEQQIIMLKNNIIQTNHKIDQCRESIRLERRKIVSDLLFKVTRWQKEVNRLDAALKANPESTNLLHQFNNACRERNSARSIYNKYKSWA